jgi:hypothetical protein
VNEPAPQSFARGIARLVMLALSFQQTDEDTGFVEKLKMLS